MHQELETAFLTQLNPHLGLVQRVCRLYGRQAEERQDLQQEILYQLWKAYPHFRGTAQFSTWLYRVALNTALTYERQRRRRPVAEPLEDWVRTLATPPEGPEAEQLRVLYSTIEQLSAVDKAVVLLYLEEQPYAQIAAVTGLSVSHVSVRLVRIRKKLEQTRVGAEAR
ncbi:sigma-70 family RNA polymerase sigma factor [Hymenobacter sp. GOD-10R]|uniref:RNA polymerase sigma factor n=1 Tax=Hymenobacter sp. GOD-10R TaxID=3093922 RepID=UPI002D7981CA|nr:sigma-70 family RNA polymerase sigma factor [Hymenobacter sp. GOD-10R]WRQ31151.1 sigma-70 family RNA polymerase sigma factor [Hymenobacter sp. GOD-10R]